jgi:methionine synthase I (cobalamin-dependent)
MRSRRNTFGCNLVNFDNYDIADKIREPALKGTAIAKRVGSSWASRRLVTT